MINIQLTHLHNPLVLHGTEASIHRSTSKMGQVIGSFLAENEEHQEDDTVEQLQILQKLAAAKLEAQASKIANAAFEDECLPIVAVVDKVERYAVKAESAPSDKVRECISNIFQGQFLKGLENAVGTAVNELLGNTSAGEQERSETHVVFANNSLLRVDYYCYKYEFGSHGLRDKFRNAFSYVVQVGVLDNLRVDPQVALYELGKSIGRNQIREASETLDEDANLLEHLYHVIKRLRKAAADDETEPQNPPAMQERNQKSKPNDSWSKDRRTHGQSSSSELHQPLLGYRSAVNRHGFDNYLPSSAIMREMLTRGGDRQRHLVFDATERPWKTKETRYQLF